MRGRCASLYCFLHYNSFLAHPKYKNAKICSDNIIAVCEMSKLVPYLTEILGFFVFFALQMDFITFRMLISVKGNKKCPVLRSWLHHGNTGIPVFSCVTRRSVNITFVGSDAWKWCVTKQCAKKITTVHMHVSLCFPTANKVRCSLTSFNTDSSRLHSRTFTTCCNRYKFITAFWTI